MAAKPASRKRSIKGRKGRRPKTKRRRTNLGTWMAWSSHFDVLRQVRQPAMGPGCLVSGANPFFLSARPPRGERTTPAGLACKVQVQVQVCCAYACAWCFQEVPRTDDGRVNGMGSTQSVEMFRHAKRDKCPKINGVAGRGLIPNPDPEMNSLPAILGEN